LTVLPACRVVVIGTLAVGAIKDARQRRGILTATVDVADGALNQERFRARDGHNGVCRAPASAGSLTAPDATRSTGRCRRAMAGVQEGTRLSRLARACDRASRPVAGDSSSHDRATGNVIVDD
jgi:hypothetical protein